MTLEEHLARARPYVEPVSYWWYNDFVESDDADSIPFSVYKFLSRGRDRQFGRKYSSEQEAMGDLQEAIRKSKEVPK